MASLISPANSMVRDCSCLQPLALAWAINFKMMLKRLLIIFVLLQSVLSAQEDRQRVFTLLPALGMNACQVHGDNYSGYNKFGFFGGAAVNARLNNQTSL